VVRGEERRGEEKGGKGSRVEGMGMGMGVMII
jgi:hypothetical protein